MFLCIMMSHYKIESEQAIPLLANAFYKKLCFVIIVCTSIMILLLRKTYY